MRKGKGEEGSPLKQSLFRGREAREKLSAEKQRENPFHFQWLTQSRSLLSFNDRLYRIELLLLYLLLRSGAYEHRPSPLILPI